MKKFGPAHLAVLVLVAVVVGLFVADCEGNDAPRGGYEQVEYE